MENKRVREGKERKGTAEYFGANLTHLLNLVQVTDAQDLPSVWEALAKAHPPAKDLHGPRAVVADSVDCRHVLQRGP